MNVPFAWWEPSSRLSCPCQAGRRLVGPVVAATQGPPAPEPSEVTPGEPGVVVDTGRWALLPETLRGLLFDPSVPGHP